MRLRLRGREVVARPELVGDGDEVEALLGRMLAGNPRLGSFVPFVERDGRIERSKLQTALDYGFCVVRWHLGEAYRPLTLR